LYPHTHTHTLTAFFFLLISLLHIFLTTTKRHHIQRKTLFWTLIIQHFTSSKPRHHTAQQFIVRQR
jgi:hypothetical protein